MTFCDILVHADETGGGSLRAQLAVQLAGTHKASVSAAFLRSQFLDQHMFDENIAYMPPLDLDSMVSEFDAAVTKASEAARKRFEAMAADRGVVSDWNDIAGADFEELVRMGRRFDLTVLPPMLRATFGQPQMSSARLGLRLGGPILVVGEHEGHDVVGDNVLIAWNGSREAARALRDAWGMLRIASKVSVVMVDRTPSTDAESQLQRHFERHGIRADVIVDDSKDIDAAAVLRRQVQSLGADLVVMGLYGRSRFSEFVLGGVTHDLMCDPPAPLFMSH